MQWHSLYAVIASVGVASLALAGCTAAPQKPPMTPLEIQSIQTRDFEASKTIVFASVVSVFQDLGYTIKSANKDTGFINAESPTQQPGRTAATSFVKEFLGVENLSVMEQTAATAFVEEIRATTRVRLNFVTTTQSSSVQGQNSRRDNAILDTKVYTNAFERIENAIFIRSGE